ncbi:MAG: hypothetical protein JW919_03005 [Candidatus Omnitrophica bacterium]|nr:hypothetical protein [Candidatus Omnitrophota bacterium]
MAKAKSVVLGVTGSIAAYKACEVIRLLKKESCEVTVLLTPEGEKFITPLTLQTLSSNKVVTGMFEVPEDWDPAHVALADKADLVLIAPATAHIIGKIASGLCDDIVSCVVCATKAPVLIAPAMNANMYMNKAVQENITKLKRAGYKFAGPVRGMLACGYEGIGCLAAPSDIVKEAKRLLKR